MPYNNTPIAPPQETTGTVSLPLARVKKIIQADDDIGACSNNAAFSIAIATEMFIQHMVEQTFNVIKADVRRPRRNIQYKDVANAVSRVDNLEFLSDVVPQTITYKQYKEKRAKDKANGTDALTNGQRTLDQMGKREDRDVEMEDAADDEESFANGHGAPNQTTSAVTEAGSPNTRRSNLARHSFDAVRNEVQELGPE